MVLAKAKAFKTTRIWKLKNSKQWEVTHRTTNLVDLHRVTKKRLKVGKREDSVLIRMRKSKRMFTDLGKKLSDYSYWVISSS